MARMFFISELYDFYVLGGGGHGIIIKKKDNNKTIIFKLKYKKYIVFYN